MRTIETKKEAERKSKRNQLIVGGILIFIMLGSTFGYVMFGSSDNTGGTEKVNYNGYEFVNQNGFWVTSIGSYEFVFSYNPEQVERINASVNSLNTYSGKVLYFFYEDDASAVEISRNMGNVVLRFQGACIDEEGCPENWPIRDCTNNFIIIKEANESNIYQEDNCVFIEAPRENLTQVTDEFLFKITGIEN